MSWARPSLKRFIMRVAASPTGSPLSDAVLLAELRAGDEAALDILLERHWSAIYHYAYRRTGSADAATDVAQDVFCRLWERRASWSSDGSVRGLLFRLARNAAVSQHRSERGRARAAGVFTQLHLSSATQPLAAERAEIRAALLRAVGELPPRRREVFQLRMMDNLSYEEIADAMGTSRQTVANQLSAALTTLRRALAHLLD